MAKVTRADLNVAADAFFNKLLNDVDGPRAFSPDNRDNEVAEQLEHSEARLRELRDQALDGSFDGAVRSSAIAIAAKAGTVFDALDETDRRCALQLAARAHIQEMEAYHLALSAPGGVFQKRPLYSSEDHPATAASRPQDEARKLGAMVGVYMDVRRREGVSPSTVAETGRALAWMIEGLGAGVPIAEVTSEDARNVRDGFRKMDVRKRGSRGPFIERQTENAQHWIGPQTSGKYWRSAQAFFAWLMDERYIDANPAAGIKMPKAALHETKSPDAFTNDEVDRLLRSPLFAGRKHRNSYVAGDYLERGGHWWTGMLGLFTGMRAGEMSQLEVDDFDFGAPIPVIKVRRVNAEGEVTKRTKNKSSIRDIPISPVLLKLGLQAFVATRAKAVGTRRVFSEFPLGVEGKTSSGMSHFYSRYLRATKLWKEGRATHVFRHTVVANLRSQGVAEEIISAIVGHTPGTQTSRYGGNTRPLSELADAIGRLDYGVDVPALVSKLETKSGEGVT